MFSMKIGELKKNPELFGIHLEELLPETEKSNFFFFFFKFPALGPLCPFRKLMVLSCSLGNAFPAPLLLPICLALTSPSTCCWTV